eukprot:CAMPEP_0194337410 /NCGR_PEP_ID=MMETSP0171-20130528/76192_1 /TAXON_ID=218684 /ORGANISM="Corethron pennatum, Strain L29A3" /LENGTH=610 /DNA_ID=CAMNT_0039101177 /DNA_START=326 /DNA_END=2154 /DNA_ORIENTATION=-
MISPEVQEQITKPITAAVVPKTMISPEVQEQGMDLLAITFIAEMVMSSGKVSLSTIPVAYREKTGKNLTYIGKLKKNIETIPDLKIEGNHVVWTGQVKTKKDGVSSGVKMEDPNRGSSTERSSNRQSDDEEHTMTVDVEDTTADIITFEEAINRKASSPTGIADFMQGAGHGVTGFGVDENILTAEEMAHKLFSPSTSAVEWHRDDIGKGISLCNQEVANQMKECALLGHLSVTPSNTCRDPVFLNTHEPFVLTTIGVQGAGKSHTTSCVLESCLVPFEPGNIVKLKAPMVSLVLHYDQNTTSICESAGLLLANSQIHEHMMKTGTTVNSVPKSKAVIMVSPTFYRQRKAFYGDRVIVRPLLFKWKSLTADHIKRIMRINDGDNQLYVASFMDLLRAYQRKDIVPSFLSFLEEVRRICNIKGQQGPLDQRIALLESMVAESSKNADLQDEGVDLASCCSAKYSLIIADLTDPLLSKEEANGMFQVLTEQFRVLPSKGGKVLCLDEAHKFMDGVKSDGLSEALVNVARLMRHDGMRLVVSTQSPKALAPELLELVTVACLHHFHSPDWWTYLRSKLALPDRAWQCILSLKPGDALAFATSHNFKTEHEDRS